MIFHRTFICSTLFQNHNLVVFFLILCILSFPSSLNNALTLSSFCRVCCPEPGDPGRDPPAGELPCSRMWSLQESQSQTAAGDSRPLWSTLTLSPLTPSSSRRPHSRGTTGNGHIGMSMSQTVFLQIA